MRSRIVPLIGFTAVALATATTFAPMVSANSPPKAASHHSVGASRVHLHAAPSTTCAKQLANDNGVGIVSQNFAASEDAFDSQGADDFHIKSLCSVSKVYVNGAYFSGAGPADSMHVTFYRDRLGTPGKIRSDQDGLAYTDASGTGNFTISLSRVVNLPGPHRYWVSVQANMDLATGGEWGWNTNNTARGFPSKWRNPSDGFGTTCTTYKDTLATCASAGEGPDFTFALLK